MPTRTKEPRRQLTVLDASGIETTLMMERVPGVRASTRVAFAQMVLDPTSGGQQSLRTRHVEMVFQELVPRAVPTIDAATGVGLTPVWMVADNADINPGIAFNAQVIEKKVFLYRHWVGEAQPTVYEAQQLTFDEATARKVAAAINTFSTHFESGAAAANRLEAKNAKLGRRVLVGVLRTWVNPVRSADLEMQRAEHGQEDMNVYVFPDSGTDTIELESVGHRKRPPFFTSANVLTARYMNWVIASAETVGHDSTQLTLVRPLEGFARYDREVGFPVGIVGLYALTTDLYSLLHKIHTEQQRGWTVSAHGNIDNTAVRNFPFTIGLEEVSGGQGAGAEVTSTAEARVEYDGKPKGLPRVRITATGQPKQPFFKRTARSGPKPRIWTATLPQLAANEWTDDEGTMPMGVFAQRIRIRPADLQRILVALDARYERGLKGLSGLVRNAPPDVLAQFDKATLVMVTKDPAFASSRHSLKLKDLRFIDMREPVYVNGKPYAIDARVSDDELTIDDGSAWWPLRYIGAASTADLRHLAQHGKLSVSAPDIAATGEEAHIELNPGDAEQLLVHLDSLEEDGRLAAGRLAGLGTVVRRNTGAIIHLQNIMKRNSNGVLEPMHPFANACHSGGAASTLSMLAKYIEVTRLDIASFKYEPQALVTNFLDEEGDTPAGQKKALEEVLQQLVNTLGQLEREVMTTSEDIGATTPVCFADRKMISTHEGTHAVLALNYPLQSNSQQLERNTNIRLATQEFLNELGPAAQMFWSEFGSELLPETSRTEEVLTGIMGMSVAVRMSVHGDQQKAAAIAEETADAFSSYLRPYQRFVDKQALKQVMWNAASELVARYPSDTAALNSFLGLVSQAASGQLGEAGTLKNHW